MVQAVSRRIQQRQQQMAGILPLLKRMYPQAHCTLAHRNPLQLLVATILSAQCTDARVNQVTPALFKRYRTAADYAHVSQEQFERDIQSTGFYRNKTKAIRGMAQVLLERYRGKVPDSMEALVELPGVGRKTANVVLGNAFGKAEGVVVDTHVARVAKRLALTSHTNPVRIEQDLMAVVPKEDWTLFPHLLINHGRRICQARKPKCDQCPLLPHCPAGQVFTRRAKKP